MAFGEPAVTKRHGGRCDSAGVDSPPGTFCSLRHWFAGSRVTPSLRADGACTRHASARLHPRHEPSNTHATATAKSSRATPPPPPLSPSLVTACRFCHADTREERCQAPAGHIRIAAGQRGAELLWATHPRSYFSRPAGLAFSAGGARGALTADQSAEDHWQRRSGPRRQVRRD